MDFSLCSQHVNVPPTDSSQLWQHIRATKVEEMERKVKLKKGFIFFYEPFSLKSSVELKSDVLKE